ncbi:MAG: M20 family metallopeptidase [Candidatus Accumulibacter sp.]|jgi:glutamate carboxypeptidase|nr:M20 family metallopeptidase [Accumulibacter sp.]
MKQKAFQYIDENKAGMLKLWEEIVNMESGSACLEGLDILADKLLREFSDAGAVTRKIGFEKAGGIAIGLFPGGEKPPVLLSGHMDTVFKSGEVQKRPFTLRDGLAYGPGVLDMKGGIVIALFVAKALKSAGFNDRPIKLLFAGDEEIGHLYSDAANAFMEEAKGCAAAFNCETGLIDNSIIVGRKGMANFKAVVHGVASHAGNDPKRGRSAILEMAHKVIDIQNLTNWDEGYTFNVGTIEGGTVVNAVPGRCEISVDIRFIDPAITPKLKAMVEEVLAKTYIEGTTTELLSFNSGIQAMKTTEGVEKLFALWKKTSEENGFGVPLPTHSGGASDAAYLVLADVPTLCSTGVKGANNHSPEEYAVVDSLYERAKLIIATILKLDEL